MLGLLGSILGISTHSLTRRLTKYRELRKKLVGHFDSQPHEEADYSHSTVGNSLCISTHSLTRRLTTMLDYYFTETDISTHSLTRRLTDITEY